MFSETIPSLLFAELETSLQSESLLLPGLFILESFPDVDADPPSVVAFDRLFVVDAFISTAT